MQEEEEGKVDCPVVELDVQDVPIAVRKALEIYNQKINELVEKQEEQKIIINVQKETIESYRTETTVNLAQIKIDQGKREAFAAEKEEEEKEGELSSDSDAAGKGITVVAGGAVSVPQVIVTTKTTVVASRGEKTIEVESNSGFQVGQKIRITSGDNVMIRVIRELG